MLVGNIQKKMFVKIRKKILNHNRYTQVLEGKPKKRCNFGSKNLIKICKIRDP